MPSPWGCLGVGEYQSIPDPHLPVHGLTDEGPEGPVWNSGRDISYEPLIPISLFLKDLERSPGPELVPVHANIITPLLRSPEAMLAAPPPQLLSGHSPSLEQSKHRRPLSLLSGCPWLFFPSNITISRRTHPFQVSRWVVTGEFICGFLAYLRGKKAQDSFSDTQVGSWLTYWLSSFYPSPLLLWKGICWEELVLPDNTNSKMMITILWQQRTLTDLLISVRNF